MIADPWRRKGTEEQGKPLKHFKEIGRYSYTETDTVKVAAIVQYKGWRHYSLHSATSQTGECVMRAMPALPG